MEDSITRTRLDSERLAALRAAGLLDSAPEEAFDRLTRLAVRIVGAPAAFVSLVDEFRDFYKSHCGFGEPLATVRQLEGTTFCHYAIANDAPLVIPDTRADPIFRHVPTVESLGVAAYVGVPIRTAQGHALGSFCAIDFAPRQWTESDIEVLTELARSAEREIQLRESAREHETQAIEARSAAEQLRVSEERFRTLLEHAPIGMALVDLTGRWIQVNRSLCDITGYSEEDLLARTFQDITHPADLGTDLAQTARLRAGEISACELEKRYVRKDGSAIWVLVTRSVVRQPDGSPLYYVTQVQDIHHRKQAEEALRESEQRFRQIAETIHEVFYVSSANPFRLLYVSPAYEEVWGRSVDELHRDPRSFQEAIIPEDRARVVEALKRQMRGDNTETEYRVVRPDGSVRWILDRAFPIRDETRSIHRIVGIAEDVTGDKLAAQALRESEERYRLATRAARDVIWDWSISSGQVVWSEALRTTFGYSPEEQGGSIDKAMTWWSGCIHPDDRDRVVQHFRHVVDTGGASWAEEYRFRRADDTYAAVIDRGYIMRSADGEPIRMIGSMVDITDTKRTEAALRRHVEQLRELARAAIAVHSAPSVRDALNVITQQARVVIGAHQSITSITVDPGQAQSVDAVSLSDKYAAWRNYDAPIQGSGIYRLVVAQNRPMRMTQQELESHPDWHGFGEEAGRHPPMRGWLAVPLFGRDGRNIGLIQLSDKYDGDFTELDEAVLIQLAQVASIAIENARLYEEAVEANRTKSDFLATMSHELRTPLNAMIGYTDLLEMGIPEPVGAKAQAQIARVGLSARHLLQLIEEILTFSRLEAGREELHWERVDPRDLVREVCAIIEPLSREKGLRFDVRTAADVQIIETDPRKVRQILINLVGNAVKFTDEGGIEFTVDSEGDWVVFRVRDTGIGIAPDHLEQIFEPFLQVESGKTRRVGGTGLGLSVTRRLSRLLGGEVSVESTPGEGSVFTVRLPMRLAGSQPRGKVVEAA